MNLGGIEGRNWLLYHVFEAFFDIESDLLSCDILAWGSWRFDNLRFARRYGAILFLRLLHIGSSNPIVTALEVLIDTFHATWGISFGLWARGLILKRGVIAWGSKLLGNCSNLFVTTEGPLAWPSRAIGSASHELLETFGHWSILIVVLDRWDSSEYVSLRSCRGHVLSSARCCCARWWSLKLVSLLWTLCSIYWSLRRLLSLELLLHWWHLVCQVSKINFCAQINPIYSDVIFYFDC